MEIEKHIVILQVYTLIKIQQATSEENFRGIKYVTVDNFEQNGMDIPYNINQKRGDKE